MTKIEGEWRYFDERLGINAPWYTLPCLWMLEALDLQGKNVFEYGVGDSTLWYRRKGANCFGVDGNVAWLEKVGGIKASSENEYVNAIEINDFIYDLIIIDGDYRDNCIEKAWYHLAANGLLIIDNYKQPSVEPHWDRTERFIDGVVTEGAEFIQFPEPEHYDWNTIAIWKR